MTVARSQIVDPEVTPFYHCISRCVRRAFLCGEGFEHRKDWIEQRLQELAQLFSISVAGYAILDNHLHVLVRLEPQRAGQWSDREVARRWGKLFPPRGKDRQPLPLTEAWIKQMLADKKWISQARKRLANLGWFMKCLKEPLARKANREDNCRGAFWEARYKSIAVLDTQSLLATCAYIDLNQVAAGCATLPEESSHTSIKTRVEHCRRKGRLQDLCQAKVGSVSGLRACRNLEDDLWLCPIEDRPASGTQRAGLLEGFSLGSYLQLVDWTSRLIRDGKPRMNQDIGALLDRLGTALEIWCRAVQKMFSRERTMGIAFAFSRAHLRRAARSRGCRHLANLNGCPA